MSIQTILDDVNELANHLNDLVVLRIVGFSNHRAHSDLKLISHYPPCNCLYPTNKETFTLILKAYERARLREYHAMRSFIRTRNSDSVYKTDVLYGGKFSREDFYDSRESASVIQSARQLRQELKRFWPCERCIHEFNPTHRSYIK